MTNQDKKQWLGRYLSLKREIVALDRERERIMSLGTKITPTYSDMPHGGSGEDKIQSAVDKLTGIAEQMDSKAADMRQSLVEIETAIGNVPQENLRELLRRRYICGERFEEIAVKMNYSWRQIIRLHGDALSAFGEKMS